MELTAAQVQAIAQAVAAALSAVPAAPEPVVSAPVSTSAGQAVLEAAAAKGIVIDPKRLATEGTWLVSCHYAGDDCKDADGKIRRFRPHGVGPVLHPCKASLQGAALYGRYLTAKNSKPQDTATVEALEALALETLGISR